MDEYSSDPLTIDARKYAVIVWALGLTRGILYSISQGEFEIEQVKKILDVSSLSALAARVGCDESELAIDWSEYLSSREQDVYFQR
jgi:hypothetical protein